MTRSLFLVGIGGRGTCKCLPTGNVMKVLYRGRHAIDVTERRPGHPTLFGLSSLRQRGLMIKEDKGVEFRGLLSASKRVDGNVDRRQLVASKGVN
ncbi:hypothetical protein BLM14_25630 (plasmid) [Phyllobacterium zundukense]|nr:hypothetical protein BLM14_25630 [Phyllobacterium zundukense]